MSNYPPGASRELDRRAAEEEAWEAYVERYMDKALAAMAEDIAEGLHGGDYGMVFGEKGEEKGRFIYLLRTWGGWIIDEVINWAQDMGHIPPFDWWCNPEPDPDRRRDEREDR